jgi:hypothetical protein
MAYDNCFWEEEDEGDDGLWTPPEYDAHQMEIINQNHDTDCSVFAGPGSGKTTTCIGIVKDAISRLHWSQRSVVAIMFSKDAATNFKKRAKRCGLKTFAADNVSTLHSLAGHIMACTRARGDANNAGGMETVIAQAVLHLHHLPPDAFARQVPRYAHLRLIMVDEAQDISQVQYDFVKLLQSRLAGCALYMVGDPNQNIFQFQGGDDKFLRSHAPRNRKHLLVNYRSSAEIVHFINEHRPWKDDVEYPPMIAARGLHGAKPEWFTHRSRDDAIDAVVDQFMRYGPATTAIIGPFKINSKTAGVNDACIGLNSILDRLKRRGVDCEPNYIFGDDTHRAPTNSSATNQLYTIHGCKGLEFTHVILIDFHTNTFKKPPTEAEVRRYGYLWFVAMSRAMDRLSMHSIVNMGFKGEEGLPWKGMKGCDADTYDLRGGYMWPRDKQVQQQKKQKPRGKSSKGKSFIKSITEILDALKNRELFNETQLLHFQSLTRFDTPFMGEESLWSEECVAAPQFTTYQTLFGTAAHFFVEATYVRRHDTSLTPTFVQRLIQEANTTVVVPSKHKNGYKTLADKLGLCLKMHTVTVSHLLLLRAEFLTARPARPARPAHLPHHDKKVQQVVALIDYIVEQLHRDDVVYLREEYATSWFDRREILRQCSRWSTDDAAIFFMAVYGFQVYNNLPFLMERGEEYNTMWAYMQPFVNNIKEWVMTSTEFADAAWLFEQRRDNVRLRLLGVLDAISPAGEVVEFKFSTGDFTFVHKLQGLLQFQMQQLHSAEERGPLGPTCCAHACFRLVNIYSGRSTPFTCDFPHGEDVFHEELMKIVDVL